MNCFLVVAPPSERFGSSVIAQAFPLHYEVLDGKVWVVAGNQRTCADVCKELGIGKTGVSGVVTKIDEYYGFFDRALWESVASWRTQA